MSLCSPCAISVEHGALAIGQDTVNQIQMGLSGILWVLPQNINLMKCRENGMSLIG